MSAPVAVNTADGTCWTRRGALRGGEPLYAPEGVCSCPEFVMATLPELAEHGIVGSVDALPMPVGPEPQQPRTVLDRARAVLGARVSKDDLHLVLGNVIDYAAELERQRNAFRDQRNNVFATNEELRAKFEAQQARADTLDRLLRTAQDRVAELEAAQGTAYRASHDSITVGHYTTAAEARKHCEALVRREYDETSKVHLWWKEGEDTVDQPEDGEQELYEHVNSAAVPGPGWTHRTGYVVTPLEVAAEYDAEADE